MKNIDHLMQCDTLSNDLNEDLKAVTKSLSDTMIERQISTKTMLMGMHAFLMAIQATGHADAVEISEELCRMSDYFRSQVRTN
jgi:hypothetical protein